MRALVTGAAGFVGQWVCRELLNRGFDVFGALLETEPPRGALSAEERRQVRWIRADVRRPEDCRRLVDESAPDAVFHLAGIAFVPAASADPAAALEVNVLAAARLLGEIRERRRAGTLDPVVLVVADVAQAYVLLVERGTPGEAYNVASGTGVDVATLARRIHPHVGTDAKL